MEKAKFPVALMCRVLKVSRAGFYAWRSRPAAMRTQQDQALAAVVASIYTNNRGCYGSPRVHVELRERGHCVGRKRGQADAQAGIERPSQTPLPADHRFAA